MSLTIYCDAKHEGLWFRDLSSHLSNSQFETIRRRGSNPPVIDELVFYDRPDIILLENGIPKLVLEKTSEVPTGHNIGQRLGRIVRSLEKGVPAIMFMPFDSMKHGKHAAVCNLNARVLEGYLKMWEIHKTPAIAVNWPSDSNGELIMNGSEDNEISEIIHCFLQSRFDSKCAKFREHRGLMVAEYDRRTSIRKSYKRPPPSVKLIPTSTLKQIVSDRSSGTEQIPNAWSDRSETVLYSMNMTEQKCRREDPYTGMQFLYDYQYCRNGVSPEDKFRNLIIDVPHVSIQRWREANPNDPDRKSVLWYATANGILLQDGLITVRD